MKGFAKGGIVKDTKKVPVLLRRGEVYVSAAAIKTYGEDLLRNINGGSCDIIVVTER